MPPHPPHHHPPHHHALHRWLKNYESDQTLDEVADVMRGFAERLPTGELVLGDLTLRPASEVSVVVRAETTAHGTTRFMLAFEWADESHPESKSHDFAELLG